MVGIIVTGHGNFATGLLSSMKLIAGEGEKIIGVDFTSEDNTETLKDKMIKTINQLGDEIIVLSDLAGGSPFKVAAILSQELENKKIKIISGTNLGMLLEVYLYREGRQVDELVELAIKSGSDAIKTFELKNKIEDEFNDEDGI